MLDASPFLLNEVKTEYSFNLEISFNTFLWGFFYYFLLFLLLWFLYNSITLNLSFITLFNKKNLHFYSRNRGLAEVLLKNLNLNIFSPIYKYWIFNKLL